MKKLRLLATVVVVVVAALVALAAYESKEKCGTYHNDKTVSVNSEEIKAEVVSSPSDRAQGLSGRPCIEADQGMLFVFEKPGKYPFWMKDMKFPIDIVWINADKKVIDLDVNVSPATYPDLFVSEEPVQYVLELQTNHTKSLKIEIGTQITF